MKGIISLVNILVLVMAIFIVSSCTESSDIKLIGNNSCWAVYKMDSLHILCVPNADGSTPIILEVKN